MTNEKVFVIEVRNENDTMELLLPSKLVEIAWDAEEAASRARLHGFKVVSVNESKNMRSNELLMLGHKKITLAECKHLTEADRERVKVIYGIRD